MGKHLEDLVGRINELRELSKKAEEDRQRHEGIVQGLYGAMGPTVAEQEVIEGLYQPSTVLGRHVLTTDKDVEAILDEIIDELQLD